MAKQTKSNRWEAMGLAAAMAVAGWLFLLDMLTQSMSSLAFPWHGVLRSAPMALASVIVGLLLTEQDAGRPATAEQRQRRRDR